MGLIWGHIINNVVSITNDQLGEGMPIKFLF